LFEECSGSTIITILSFAYKTEWKVATDDKPLVIQENV